MMSLKVSVIQIPANIYFNKNSTRETLEKAIQT